MQRPGEPIPPHPADGMTGSAGAPDGGPGRPPGESPAPPWSPQPPPGDPDPAGSAPVPGRSGEPAAGSAPAGSAPVPGWSGEPAAGSAPAGSAPVPGWSGEPPAGSAPGPHLAGSGWAPYPGAPAGEEFPPYPGAYATAGYPAMSPVQGSYPVDPRSVRSRARLWPPSRAELATAAALLLGSAALGAVLAVLWVRLAPRLDFRVDQPGRALPVVPSAEEFVAADGRYVLLTLAAGILTGLLAWRVTRSRGPLVLLALAAGGLLGAVVTWQLGLLLGTGYQPADLQEVGRIVRQPLTLRARAALVVQPFAAVTVYLLAAGFAARNDLGRDEDTQEPAVPSGHPGPHGYQGPAAQQGHGTPSLPGPGAG